LETVVPPWAAALLYGTPAVLAFIDAQRHADRVWRMAGNSLLFWTLVIVLVPAFGPALHLVVARPRLQRAAGAASRPPDD
jgi:hypothetical protein